jgi:oligoendopeptidase F
VTITGMLLAAAKAGAPSAKLTSAFVPDGNLPRSAVPDLYKWNLAPLFKDDAAFETAMKKSSADRKLLVELKGRLADPAELRKCLERYFGTRLDVNKLTLYAHLRFDSDQRSTALQAMNDRALKVLSEFMTDTAFIRLEVLGLDEAAMQDAYRREPKLEQYRTYLEDVRRRRAHVLGAEAERVLALAGDNLWAEIDLNELPSDYEKAFDAARSDLALPRITDADGKEIQLTLANFPKYRASADRRVRQQTMERFFATLKASQHVFAATLSGQVSFNIFLARARGYDSALAAYLDKDDVVPAVYTNLIQAVHSNLAPLQRYVSLRKRLLGLPELHVYDLYTSMISSRQDEVRYEQAEAVLPQALAPLGESYVKVLRTGLDLGQGWLDLFPNLDKESGAFSSSAYGVHPFVKMNYLNDLEGLSVLAHEYGHALHSNLAMNAQPYSTSSYSMFVAEIASTFNEKLLSDWLLKNSKSKEEKLSVLNRLAESIRTTIYRQTLFAEFELAIHTAAEKGIPLTSDFLNKAYSDLVREYYGTDLTLGENDDIEWAYIPHFYYKYYMYSYATGLSAGIALAEKVQTEGPAARDAYLGMLKAGCSKPPLELLKTAGVDLTKPQAVEAAARLFDRTLDQIEKLLPAVPQ